MSFCFRQKENYSESYKKKDLFQPQSANSACRPKSNSTTTTILTERQMILEALPAASKAIPGGTVRAKEINKVKVN